jgi:hypothetical protein
LPKEVSSHQKGEDKLEKGNKAADEVAKWAAMQEYTAGLSSGRGLSFPQRDHIISHRKVNKPQTKGTSWIPRVGGCPLKGSYGSVRHSSGKFFRPSTNFIIWA